LTPVTENEQTLLTFIRNLHSDKIQKEDEMTHKELFDMLSVLSPSDSKKIMGHYKNYRRTDKKSRPVGDIYVEIIRRLFIQSLWVLRRMRPERMGRLRGHGLRLGTRDSIGRLLRWRKS
jgi:hypothetical protein